MKILTYFGFTLLSILVQFSVMDFIQEKIQQNLNTTSQKKELSDLLKDISHKPHALYYRMQRSKSSKVNNNLAKIYSNSSLTQSTTEVPTTIFEVLYEESENFSTTESEFGTEFTSTEFDNVTEINLFEIKNRTSKPNSLAPKLGLRKDCHCNLLHMICDINCCCDSDCTEFERKMFFNCLESTKVRSEDVNYCYSLATYSEGGQQTNIIDNLFCVVKTNLPNKRNKSSKKELCAANQYFKWHNNMKTEASIEFIKNYYASDDPVWLYKNESFFYLDVPSPKVNNYCTGRRPLKFLKEEKITCIVKIGDLEMFQVIKNLEEGHIISVTEKTMNSSVLNCSTLHCVNWKIIVCDANTCGDYDKSLHEPLCTENICINLALKLDYIFYYYNAKIVNATVKFYIKNLSMSLPFITQELNVNFFMANESMERIIEFSGNPGYIHGLPVIVSFAEINHTETFYNNMPNKYITLPSNVDGMCILTNTTNNYVLFGINKRLKCHYNHEVDTVSNNNTDLCKSIQNNITMLFGLNNKIVISPYGNPHGVSDKDWIPLQNDLMEMEPVYRKNEIKSSWLHCYNLITTIAITFSFDDFIEGYKGQNKILSARIETTAKNITFNMDDISTVLTIDISFLDETKPSVYEYAGSPHLNINLPKDFFFPFPSNNSNTSIYMYFIMIYCCLIVFFCK